MPEILILAGVSDAQVASLQRRPASIRRFCDEVLARPGDSDLLTYDLERGWRAIDEALAELAPPDTDPPLAFLAEGGLEVGREKIGRGGPARTFTSDEVAALAAALCEVDWRGRMRETTDDAPLLDDSYRRDDPYLERRFEVLRSFVGEVAESGLGMVIFMV
jgi:hypothetical protein